MVLYEMIADYPPFTATRREQIYTQRNLRSPPRQVTEACAALLQRMLAVDPEKRISFVNCHHPFVLGNPSLTTLSKNLKSCLSPLLSLATYRDLQRTR
jgi:serine/threonine protein kinase